MVDFLHPTLAAVAFVANAIAAFSRLLCFTERRATSSARHLRACARDSLATHLGAMLRATA